MNGALTWQLHENQVTDVSEIHGSIWDQRNYADVLDCSFVVTWLGTANELQQRGANPGTGTCGNFLIAMENETGETCFYYMFNIYGYYYAENNKSWKNLYGD